MSIQLQRALPRNIVLRIPFLFIYLFEIESFPFIYILIIRIATYDSVINIIIHVDLLY